MTLPQAKCPYFNANGVPCGHIWTPRVSIEEVKQCPGCKKFFAPWGSYRTAKTIIALLPDATPKPRTRQKGRHEPRTSSA